MKSKWILNIEDPSGQMRTLPLDTEAHCLRIGRSQKLEIPLRDPLMPLECARLDFSGQQFWFRIEDAETIGRLGDMPVREAQLLPEVPLYLGNSVLTLKRRRNREGRLPEFPTQLVPWLTQDESGTRTVWLAKKAAATPLSIYLAGETGTGKEVLAHLVHAWSDREQGPFVPLHCGALPPSLAESELFGHVKGAYTGASQHRVGALMQAHRGTLFLDEIGDLSMDIQVKLLRFLENGEVRPVGSDRIVRADVRIVCATHQPLKTLVEEGKFRRDLYYRLASVTVEIPTLRSRPADIDLLSRRFAKDLGRAISERALSRLQAHPWPGNVRELRHAVERAAGLAGPYKDVLTEDCFDFLQTENQELNISAAEPEPGSAPTGILRLDEAERMMVLRALRACQGNRCKAAKMLGVARSTLFDMIKRHRIAGPRMVFVN